MMRREIQKQIHLFLLAFLADVTALSVCFDPVSMSMLTPPA
jgi:hypothetical protein